MPAYQYRSFGYRQPPGFKKPEKRHPVLIIGAGPVGLALAIDLALRGIKSVVLDDNDVVSVGSRAICWAKRTLEIFNRLGIGERILGKGVTWQTGRLFHGEREVYSFDLLPEKGHKYPAFINLQQYYLEEYLIERARDFPDLIDLRFKNRVVDHCDHGDHVRLKIETPDGRYLLEGEYIIACDGAASPTRTRMQLPFSGQTFDEHFLIIDIEMAESPFATPVPERWFWFKPPFHHGQSALLHKQPDNIYRIDLQLGTKANPKEEAQESKVLPRIKAITGDKSFRLDWMSVYRFRCARIDQFVHNRIIFAGDGAHVVSPFGARGGNGGIQDIDNLGWKLAAILTGQSSPELLATYHQERSAAADENIINSSRATSFMTPKSPIERLFRDQVLNLAKTEPFARRLINSGRLSVPCRLPDQALQTTPSNSLPLKPGDVVVDLPLTGPKGPTWLIDETQNEFTVVIFGQFKAPIPPGIKTIKIGNEPEAFKDCNRLASDRYGENCAYLLRPDGHIAANFTNSDPLEIDQALARARGQLFHKGSTYG